MYKDCQQCGNRTRTTYTIQESTIVDDVVINLPRIYAYLDNSQANDQSNMVDIEGKISKQPIAILIDLGVIHNYIAPNLFERFHLERSKHNKSWWVQVSTGKKRKTNEIAKSFPLDKNGLNTFVDFNTHTHFLNQNEYRFIKRNMHPR